jgi:hypothetical protein
MDVIDGNRERHWFSGEGAMRGYLQIPCGQRIPRLKIMFQVGYMDRIPLARLVSVVS